MTDNIKRPLLLIFLLIFLIPAGIHAQETECADGSQLIVHDLGETCVPADVERIVTIEHSMTEAVVTLGIQPVGVADLFWYNELVQLPATEAIDIGTRQEPNLETIAELEPDLIVAASWRISEVYEQLGAIAPTITFEGSSDMAIMTDYFTRIAVALNREAEAEQILADMEAYFVDASERVANADIDPNFVLSLTWFADENAVFRLYTENAFPIEILESIGLENTWNGEVTPDGFTVVDIEALGEIEDTNFLFITDAESAPFYEESSLWNSLPFVQDGNAYRLDDSLWLWGGPISAQRLADAVLDVLGVEALTNSANDDCEDGYRLFERENIFSSVCVPETAERIVTLDPFYSLQMSLEMGLSVIGSSSFTSDGGFPDALSPESLEGVEVIGAFDAPNLETITTLAPDLIIGDAFFLSEQFDLFNEIAPTVLVSGANWKSWYSTIAAAAGVPEQAETAFEEYDARIADLQALIPDDMTVSFLRIVPDGFQLYREAPNPYAPVAVMSEAGVTRPDFESGTDEESFARLDFEGLANIEGDLLLYVVGGANDDAAQLEEDTTGNPIWQLLPAVQAERAYRVGTSHWMSFGGLTSAHAVLDDLFTYVAGVDPQEVSPNPFLTD